jgi:hypothetical protein
MAYKWSASYVTVWAATVSYSRAAADRQRLTGTRLPNWSVADQCRLSLAVQSHPRHLSLLVQCRRRCIECAVCGINHSLRMGYLHQSGWRPQMATGTAHARLA